MSTIILCGFQPREISACRLMTRGMSNVLLVPVAPEQMGGTVEEALMGKTAPSEGIRLSGRMAIFAGAEGSQLEALLPIPSRATGEPVLKAALTKTNRKWTLQKLHGELMRENRALEKYTKK